MKYKPYSRRHFIKQTGAISLGFLGLQLFVAGCSNDLKPTDRNNKVRIGKLLKDPKGILDLPKGFSYKIISCTGEPMSDGLITPDKPDGMGTFEGADGRTIIVRNHETMLNNKSAFGENNELLSKIDSDKFYDFGKGITPCPGGTTTLIFNEDTQTVEKSWLSLTGTLRNCAGGPTPWNSWITCEEIVLNASGNYEKNHGFNFEVPATESPELQEAIPLKEMGRFNHEAVCIDPRTGIVYQTEDRSDGLIYRFIPTVKGKLQEGGRLQILGIKDKPSKDTRNWAGSYFRKNKPKEVVWLDIDDIMKEEDDLRYRGFKQGAARFARGEGIWFGNNEIYFACTNGGKTQTGQVFRYIPSEFEGQGKEIENPGTLELFLEPNNTHFLRYCDNLTIAPWGDVILCEDNTSPRILGVTPHGKIYKLAHNVGFASELAGAVFSPSGKTLFVNIQHAGKTLAITGPWPGQMADHLTFVKN